MDITESIMNNTKLRITQKKYLIDDMVNNNHTIYINFNKYITDNDALLYACENNPHLYKFLFSHNFYKFRNKIFSMNKYKIKDFFGIIINQSMNCLTDGEIVIKYIKHFEDVVNLENMYEDIVNSNTCARHEYLQVHNYFRNNKVDINKYADKLIIAHIKDKSNKYKKNRNFMIDIDIPLTHAQIELLNTFGLYPPLDNSLTRELIESYIITEDAVEILNLVNKYPYDTIHGIVCNYSDIDILSIDIPKNRIHVSFATLLSNVFVYYKCNYLNIQNDLKSCKTLEDFENMKKIINEGLDNCFEYLINLVNICVVNVEDFALCQLF